MKRTIEISAVTILAFFTFSTSSVLCGATYRNGSLEFQYPTGWNLQEQSGGVQAVIIRPPGCTPLPSKQIFCTGRNDYFYIATREIAPGISDAVQHETEVREFMNRSGGWTRTNGPDIDRANPVGRVYVSALRKGETIQSVATVCKRGRVVVVVYVIDLQVGNADPMSLVMSTLKILD